MTDVGPALLVGASFLLTHWLAITTLVYEYGRLPDHWLSRPFTLGNRDRGERWANTIVAVLIGLLATVMMGVFVFAGGLLTIIGGAELVLAGWWLVYLLRANGRS